MKDESQLLRQRREKMKALGAAGVEPYPNDFIPEQGALEIAQKINRKRETVHQLQVILETHHADVAAGLIANLYQLVQAELDAALASNGLGSSANASES